MLQRPTPLDLPLKPVSLETVLCNKRKPTSSNEDPEQPKINKYIKYKKRICAVSDPS